MSIGKKPGILELWNNEILGWYSASHPIIPTFQNSMWMTYEKYQI
jgi:hypothetical protein